MENYIDPKFIMSWISSLWVHFVEVVSNTKTLLEVAVIIVALLAAYLVAGPLKKRLQRVLDEQKWRDRVPGRLIRVLLPLISFLVAILLLKIGAEALAGYKLPTVLIDTAARLLTAWLIIRLVTAMLKDSKWARLLSVAAWFIAALHILNLLIPVINLLDRLAIEDCRRRILRFRYS